MDAENNGERRGDPPAGSAPDPEPSLGSAPPPPDPARLKAILDALPDILFVLDRDGRILDYHAPRPELLFVAPTDFLGRNIADVLPAPAAGIVRQAFAEAVATGRHRGATYPLPGPDGDRWFELSIAAQDTPPAANRFVAIARDVTDRLRAEEVRRESERNYRMLTEGMQDVVWILDVEARRFTYVSPSVERLRGYTAAEVLAQPLEQAWIPAENARMEEFTRRSLADFLAGRTTEDTYLTYEVLQPCKDGSVVATEIVARLVRNPRTGRIEGHGVSRDVSARKRAEAALRDSEQAYRMLTEGMQDVVWVLDVEARRFTYVSPSVERLRGYTAAEVLAQPLEQAWVPEERERLAALLQGYVADFLAGRITANTYVPIEFLQPCKDGSAVSSEAICHLLRNARTGRLELHGVTRDISTRKHAEDALRESEIRFEQVTRQSRAFVWEVDAAGLYMFVSPVVEDVLGYRPDEIAGRLCFYDLHPADDREAFRTEVFAAMDRRESFRDYENPMVAKDGRTMWVSTNAIPLLDARGALLGYRGVDFDVTERKRAEEALRESERRLRTLNDNLPGGLVYQMDTGADGRERRLLAVSKGVERLHGVTVEQALGNQKTFYLQVVPEDQARVAELEARAIATLSPFRAEVRCRMPSGEIRWIYVSSAPRRLPNGHLVWDGIEIDVTDRKQAEEALRESEAQRRAINDNLPDGFIYQIDSGADGQHRRYVYVSQGVEKLHGVSAETVMRDPTCIYGQILAEDLAVVAEKETQAIAAMAPFSAVVRVRLPSGEIRWRLFTSAPRRLANGHLVWDGIEIDVTERKLAEEALRESEARARAIQDNLPDGLVYQIDSGPNGQDRRFLFISQGVERLHGVSAEEVLRDPMAIYGQVLPDDLRGVAAQEARAAAALAPLQVEVRVRLPSGEIRWRRFASAPRRLANGHLVWDGIEIDVTDRKLAEEALRASEARFAASTKASRSYVWQVDPEGLITYISPMVEEVLGHRPEDLVGQLHFYDLLPEEDREEMKIAGLALMARRETISGLENRNVTRDGRLAWVSSSATPLFGPDGAFLGYQGIDTDITARKQAEEALRESEARFAAATQASRSFVWQVDPDGRYTYVGDMVADVLGYRPEDLIGKMHFYDLLPPESRAELKQACLEMMARHESPSGFENLNVAKDGRLVWLSSSAHPLFAADGSFRGYQGIDTDVTERKRTEEALKASETRYRGLIDFAVDGILLGSPDGIITDANACMCALAGRTRRELVGKHVAELFDPQTRDEAPMRFDLVHQGGTVTRVRRIVRPDASEVFVEMHSKQMSDGTYQSIFHDITQRRQAEEALRASEAKYRYLHETMRDAFATADLHGRIQEFNAAFLDLVGYSAKELRGLSYRRLTPRKWQAREKEILEKQVLPRGYSDVYEKEYRRKDGTVVPVELRTILIRDDHGRPTGMWASIRDIADRKRAEAALRQAHDELERRVQERTAELVASQLALAESEEQFRQMAENVQDGFWLIDAKTGKTLYVSPAFKQIWNWPVEKDSARWFAHLHPEDRERVALSFRNGMKTGIPASVTYRLIWPDGSVRWIESSGAMIRDVRGRPSRAAGLIRDVTERRRLEEELLKTAEVERQRIGRDLHDSLGQSLTAIGYLADAVREDLVRQKRPEARDVRKLGRLIERTANQSHALARGLLLADLKRGGLGAALQELAFRTQELFGVACRYSGPALLPPLDANAAGQLYRIAQEATANAAKHGQAKRIDVRLALRRGALFLTVRDTGRGISPRQRKRAGLGLDIMRYRAGLIGATLEIDSQSGRGTTVICRLPLAAPAPKRKK